MIVIKAIFAGPFIALAVFGYAIGDVIYAIADHAHAVCEFLIGEGE